MFNEIFHAECCYCKATILADHYVCDDCLKYVEAVEHRCLACGSSLPVMAQSCYHCFDQNYYDQIISLFYYKTVVRALLKEVKFRYSVKGVQFFKQIVNSVKMDLQSYDVITPVPSYWSRRFRRFVHPTDVLVKEVSKLSNISYAKMIRRTRRTEYQWKMNKGDRFRNMKGAFVCTAPVSKLKILLVDDIITTGSTLNECSRILKEYGAVKVDCLVFARGIH